MDRIQDILAYLQLIDNPSYTSAFVRVVNTPKRGVGDKTVRDILAAAKLRKISPFEVCVRSVNGSGMAGVSTTQRKNLRVFVKTILDLKVKAEQVRFVSSLLDLVIASN